jgi:hypothetical protein
LFAERKKERVYKERRMMEKREEKQTKAQNRN